MYPVSDAFLDAITGSHTVAVRVDAHQGHRRVATDLPIVDGDVAVSSASGVRRTLTCTIADPTLWDTLAPIGTELRAYRGVRYPDGSEELVPLGIFSLDQQSTPVVRRGAITITSAPDRWARIQRARFETPRVSDTGFTPVEQIVRLITEVVDATPSTGAIGAANTHAVTPTTTPVVWDRDRDQAVNDLATAAGLDVAFSPTGALIIRDVPTMDAAPAWRVTAGRDGVMLNATATRDRSRVYNVIVVVSTKTTGTPPFTPQIVEDRDPTSPTNVTGPYGRAPYFLSTALIGDAADALKAGRALLTRTRGRFVDMSVSAIVNPALETGDTISVTDVGGGTTRYLLDSFSVPLSTAGEQSLTLRSLAAVSGDAETVQNPTAQNPTAQNRNDP